MYKSVFALPLLCLQLLESLILFAVYKVGNRGINALRQAYLNNNKYSPWGKAYSFQCMGATTFDSRLFHSQYFYSHFLIQRAPRLL